MLLSLIRWAALPALALLAVLFLRISFLGDSVVPRPGHPDVELVRARLELAQSAQFGLVVTSDRLELVHGAVPMRDMPVLGSRGFTPGTRVVSVAARRGTLPYEPVQRVVAPTDTASAEPPAMRPLDAHPSFGVLELSDGSELRLVPDDLGFLDAAWVSSYRAWDHLRHAGATLIGAATGDSTITAPVITVRVSDDDARAVYRALPIGAPVLIRGN